ncbi:hypothetical protein VTJ04DRAFT_6755 [Mycothermus thermophilus]|uniref:uncharacterized protein n=1 Tax=Humicola insolens TaxID=85995 RepID=UPI003742C8F2
MYVQIGQGLRVLVTQHHELTVPLVTPAQQLHNKLPPLRSLSPAFSGRRSHKPSLHLQRISKQKGPSRLARPLGGPRMRPNTASRSCLSPPLLSLTTSPNHQEFPRSNSSGSFHHNHRHFQLSHSGPVSSTVPSTASASVSFHSSPSAFPSSPASSKPHSLLRSPYSRCHHHGPHPP